MPAFSTVDDAGWIHTLPVDADMAPVDAAMVPNHAAMVPDHAAMVPG